jgi:GNAT superfamily N-acetyltransferase
MDCQINVERFDATHTLWHSYVAHLRRASMVRWSISPEELPLENTVYLGTRANRLVIGHISVRIQPIQIPGMDQVLRDSSGDILNELFVQTFAVEENYRRRGYGRALQQAALNLLPTLHCCQMRSWSSFDKPANYALKISLGFAVCPATYEAPNGEKISGVYFVKTAVH